MHAYGVCFMNPTIAGKKKLTPFFFLLPWSFWCAELRGCFGNWGFCVLVGLGGVDALHECVEFGNVWEIVLFCCTLWSFFFTIPEMKKPPTIMKSAWFAFWYDFYRMPSIFVCLYLSCYSSCQFNYAHSFQTAKLTSWLPWLDLMIYMEEHPCKGSHRKCGKVCYGGASQVAVCVPV